MARKCIELEPLRQPVIVMVDLKTRRQVEQEAARQKVSLSEIGRRALRRFLNESEGEKS